MKYTKVFIFGNILNIDENFLKTSFPKSSILLLGNTQIKPSLGSKITVLPYAGDTGELRSVFDSYEFDCILFFSEYLSYKKEVAGELEKMKISLDCCKNQARAKFLYITGPRIENGIHDNAVIQDAIRKLITSYRSKKQADVKLLQIPFLYSLSSDSNYLNRLFHHIEDGKKYEIFEPREHIIPYLSMEDLSTLLFKLFDSWDLQNYIYSVQDAFRVTIGELVDACCKYSPKAEVSFGRAGFSTEILPSESDLRADFGWFPKYSVLSDFEELYRINAREDGRISKNRKKRKKGLSPGVLRSMEISVLFILVELVEALTGLNTKFSHLDFRLVFVALVSGHYGAAEGILGAGLVSVGFIASYILRGNGWQTLFYNIESWMPIVIYLFVGSLCGYFLMRKEDSTAELVRERDKLLDKYTFTRQLYSDVVTDKRMMKNEILGMRDGMGKIMQIVETLSAADFSDIRSCAVRIINEWFETESTRIYLLYPKEPQKSELDLGKYPLMEKAFAQEGIWANHTGENAYPIYAGLIDFSDEAKALVWIEEVEFEHMTLYDQNCLCLLLRLTESVMIKKYFDQKKEGI